MQRPGDFGQKRRYLLGYRFFFFNLFASARADSSKDKMREDSSSDKASIGLGLWVIKTPPT